MTTEQDFIFTASENTLPENASFTWKAPSNIALIKYWGKSKPQLPKNASISFTLDACYTQTTVEFTKSTNADITVYFEEQQKDDFKPKIQQFINRIKEYVPFITEYSMIVRTRNSFPHSSGIASSASGMAALALCMMSLEKTINPTISEDYFFQKASFLARLGSGSAARSIEGPLVVWGTHPEIKNSSDLFGEKFPHKVHENFHNFHDTILLVDKGEKQVSSTVGHNLMHNHPFAEQRFKQANKNLAKLSKVLQTGDLKSFIHIVESEALTLHAMMLTSDPYFILMKPNTLEIIQKIWKFRAETETNICFTLDAGANVHVLYPEKEKEICNKFIVNELIKYCQNQHYICDMVGFGAKQI
ncbi:MAG: diphosphomevalonate decarboxylase [Flavobacteriaceae bacterium]|nr:diphosphomevalonate decarboxylase [Flavobacteriaceae bacterium]